MFVLKKTVTFQTLEEKTNVLTFVVLVHDWVLTFLTKRLERVGTEMRATFHWRYTF